MYRIALAAAVVAGCSSVRGKAPERPRSDNAGDKIADVDVEGNDEISDDRIVSGLQTRPPDKTFLGLRSTYYRYYPYRARSDADRITAFYARRGFFDAEVEGVEVREKGESAVKVVFEVEEGEPSMLTEVAITGVPEEIEERERYEELRDRLDEGKRYNHEEYLEVKQSLRELLIDRGYRGAEVTGRVEVDRDERTVVVALDVDPGPLVRFGETRVAGLDRIPERAVRNRLPWEPGDRVTSERLEIARGRLYALGYFGSVDISLEREPEDEIARVIVRVTEADNRELRAGGGFAIDEAAWETRLRLGYVHRSFLHPLLDLRLDARPAYRFIRGETGTRGFGGTAITELSLNDAFHVPRLKMITAGFYRDERFEGYDVRGPGGRLAFDWPYFSDRVRFSAGYAIRRDSFNSVDEAIDLAGRENVGLVDGSRVAFFEQSIILDGRDSILDPTEGYYFVVSGEEAGAYTGSDFDYVLLSAGARGYLSLTDRLVAAVRVRGARVVTGDPPITQRLYSGGVASHRGFAQRRLSPFVADPDGAAVPIGGEALFDSSVELRWDIVKLWDEWFGVAVFTDIGDVAAEGDSIDFGDLHYAVGPGIRYDTLVGPIRLDLGIRVNNTGPEDPPGDRWVIHFSLGEAF